MKLYCFSLNTIITIQHNWVVEFGDILHNIGHITLSKNQSHILSIRDEYYSKKLKRIGWQVKKGYRQIFFEIIANYCVDICKV